MLLLNDFLMKRDAGRLESCSRYWFVTASKQVAARQFFVAGYASGEEKVQPARPCPGEDRARTERQRVTAGANAGQAGVACTIMFVAACSNASASASCCLGRSAHERVHVLFAME
jgi:hypothetical protein